MNFVHICLCSPYTDNWGYQENILPRVQRRQGHSVTVIATCQSYSKDNTTEIIDVMPGSYYLDDGVRVIRIGTEPGIKGWDDRIFPKYNVFDILKTIKPDAIMVHGMHLFGPSKSLIKYFHYLGKNKTKCFVCGDTHLFLEIAPRANTLKRSFIQFLHEREIKKLIPYYSKVYGITPSCIEYAKGFYGLSSDQVKLLPLGYDPQFIVFSDQKDIRKKLGKNSKLIKMRN